MQTYTIGSKKDTKNTRNVFKKTKESRFYLVSDCMICGHRKSRFVKSNCTKPGHCVICGKKFITSKRDKFIPKMHLKEPGFPYTVCEPFRDKIWDVDLPDMRLITKYNKETRYLCCAINISSKYK